MKYPDYRCFRLFFIATAILVWMLVFGTGIGRPNTPLRIGIFQNKPIVYDENGPKGLFVEVLDYVAEKEKWDVEYVLCGLKECMEKVKNNELDIMTSLGVNPERSDFLKFSKESIWTFWGTVYSNDKQINCILDLKGRTVGIRKNNKTTKAIQELLREFNILVKFVEFEEYGPAFEALNHRSVDAVAVNNTYAFVLKARGANLHKTAIVFDPFSAYFAVSKQYGDPGLLKAIDHHVIALKADRDSLYYRFQDRWFGVAGSYWTGKRIAIVSFIIILTTILGMSLWRFFSLIKVNKRLLRTIAERKRVELSLHNSKNYMQSLFRAAPTGIGVVQNRVFSQVNDTFCKMLGYTEEELVGQNSRKIYPSDEEYTTVGKVKYEGINQSGTGTVETRFQCKNGDIIDVLLSSTPIDANNLGTGVTFTALDISHIKRTEESLRSSELKYRAMMEAIKDPVYICSQDFRVQYMNPAMIGRTGYDATGKLCYKALHRFDDKCPWCRHDIIMEKGSIEQEITSPWDNRSFQVSGSTIINADGSLSKIFVLKDNTEVKKLQDRIQQAQKMEAIGDLAGGIAHDFNNILFPIAGLSEMQLDDSRPDSPEYETAREILDAARRGSALVKQILSFSRQSKHKRTPIRINAIIKEAMKLCRATIPANIEIAQEIHDGYSHVLADPNQIHQVVMNLITNAFHSFEGADGKISVQLKTTIWKKGKASESDRQHHRFERLRVADTGCGIDPVLMDKIFEPYFTTKEQGKGTGLGLAVVYGIVKGHDGELRIESAPGKGTTVNVYLPILTNSLDIEAVEPEQDIPAGSERILLIDDEPQVVAMVKQMMVRLGYHVTASTSSMKALEIFRSDPKAFDLVITDMTMPQMTGDLLVEKLKSLKPDIPVIVCTGFSERMGESRARQLGIGGLLMKPVAKSQMARMVRDVLDGNLRISKATRIDRGQATW